jgi:hypothetical protein
VVVVVKDCVVSGVVLTVVPVPNSPPAKVHAVLSVDDQLRVVVAPFAIEVGVAERVAVGAGVGLGESFPLLHEARPETATSAAKKTPSRTLETAELLFDTIVSLQ